MIVVSFLPHSPPSSQHSCIVDDGHGDRVELIDEQGCARDKYLLQNLDYISDLMVGKEAHVYKYADRERLTLGRTSYT